MEDFFALHYVKYYYIINLIKIDFNGGHFLMKILNYFNFIVLIIKIL